MLAHPVCYSHRTWMVWFATLSASPQLRDLVTKPGTAMPVAAFKPCCNLNVTPMLILDVSLLLELARHNLAHRTE
uniref:Uncharacterized protein n=1 Tax=Physcomitrium patens TaxID=3218 RepID=A0A2K1JUW4_PHYPA|nr:hypothetical protein PHYPA_015090 [Physcomitrium patens]